MCSTYIIKGTRCETGQDLVDMFGLEVAHEINPPVGDPTDWDECCLCHVDRTALERITGTRYELDPFDFVPAPPIKG